MSLAIDYVEIDSIQPHPQNPRQGDVQAIIESIKSNGVYRPITVQKSTGYILAGNHTWKAIKALGYETIGVVFMDYTDEQAKSVMLADNRTADLGEYDSELLVSLLQELDDLAGTGYEDNDLDHLLADIQRDTLDSIDEEPEVPETSTNPITKPGDVWILGEHKVICGDSTKPETYEKLLGDSKADMIWTDPPYGVNYVGRTDDALTIKNDGADDLPGLLENVFILMARHARPAAPVYIAFASNNRTHFENACAKAEIDIKQELIWVKNTIVLGRSDYHFQHEPILYGFTNPQNTPGRKGRGGKHWYGDNTASTIFHIDKPPANREHPTMKPINLITPMIMNSSKPSGLILDPFGGSGSTLLACHRARRRAALIELDERFVDVICKRFQVETGIVPVLESTGMAHDFVE